MPNFLNYLSLLSNYKIERFINAKYVGKLRKMNTKIIFSMLISLLALTSLISATESTSFEFDDDVLYNNDDSGTNIESSPYDISDEVIINYEGIGIEPVIVCSVLDSNACRGDVNQDNKISKQDVEFLIAFLYENGEKPYPFESADVNNDTIVNIFDITYLISYLYKNGSAPVPFQINTADNYLRGDVNKDGIVGDLDVDFLINYLYKEGNAPNPLYLADVNNDAIVNIFDITYLISYLHKQGPEPVALDITIPIIRLLDPKNDYTKKTNDASYEIDFEYSVSDASDILYCELIIDNDVGKTDNNVEKDTKNKFIVNLDRGSYGWKIKCVDLYGNEAVSEERDLEIRKRTSSSISTTKKTSENLIAQDISNYQTIEQINLNKIKDSSFIEKINWFIVLLVLLILGVFVLFILIFRINARGSLF